MSDERPAAAEEPFALRSHDARMARDAVIPTLAVGVVAVALGAWLRGPEGALAAGIGSVVVVAFFGSGLLVSARTATWAASTGMAVAVAAHAAKVVLCGILLAIFGGASWFDGDVLALTLVATTITWLGGQLRGFTRLKLFSVVPDGSSQRSDAP